MKISVFGGDPVTTKAYADKHGYEVVSSLVDAMQEGGSYVLYLAPGIKIRDLAVPLDHLIDREKDVMVSHVAEDKVDDRVVIFKAGKRCKEVVSKWGESSSLDELLHENHTHALGKAVLFGPQGLASPPKRQEVWNIKGRVLNAFQERLVLPGSKVLIVMLYDEPVERYSVIAEHINRKYAFKQGYDLVAIHDRVSNRAPQWDKVRAMEILLNHTPGTDKYEWFFWIDSDAVFAKHGVDLKAILDGTGGDFVISDDAPNRYTPQSHEVFTNTGTFGIKNTDWARKFISKWWRSPMGLEHTRYHEQDVLNQMWIDDTYGLKKRLVLLPAEKINSIYGKLPGLITSPRLDATFVLHMMRKPHWMREKVFRGVEKMLLDQDSRVSYKMLEPPPKYYQYSPLSAPDNNQKKVVVFALLAVVVTFLVLLLAMGWKKKK
jgi:hypothetical protein